MVENFATSGPLNETSKLPHHDGQRVTVVTSPSARFVRCKLHRLVCGMMLVACACAGAIRQPKQSDADWASAQWDPTTVETLRSGRRAYVARCGECHGLYAPQSRDADGWVQAIELMRTEHGVNLEPPTRDAMVRYLGAMGR